MNYRVYWIGITEGYGVKLTKQNVDNYEVFKLFSEAKKAAVERAKDDVNGSKRGLQQTRLLTKRDI